MRVCLVAYACRPGSGSEPGVGWKTALQLAQEHEVWIITRSNNAGPIEAALAQSPIPSLHVDYHEVTWAVPFKRGFWAVYPYSYLWQASVHSSVKRLHDKVGFDVAHQITFGSFRYPSSLYKLGLPYLLGPLGGGEETPVSFWWGLGPRGLAFEAIRWVSNRVAVLDPLIRRGLSRASVVVAASPDTARFLQRRGLGNATTVPSIAVDVQPLEARTQRAGHEEEIPELRALFVGRLEAWKGVHLGISAIALARSRGIPVRLAILGSGPQEGRLRSLIDRSSLSEVVDWLPRQSGLTDVRKLYRQSDFLLFPSLHDSGGMVVVEAMEAGLPVVCLDLGGPSLSVTPDTGIRIRAARPRQAINDLAKAIELLWQDPDRRRSMGDAGRSRALDFYAWSTRAQAFDSLYSRVVNGQVV